MANQLNTYLNHKYLIVKNYSKFIQTTPQNDLEREVYFELPDSSIRGIPLHSASGERLSIGLVEVGCKAEGKSSQLRDKRKLFTEYWAKEYYFGKNINWIPCLYRCLVHYDPEKELQLSQQQEEIDLVIFYQNITPEMLERLTLQEREKLSIAVRDKKELLDEILTNKDAERLHKLIIQNRLKNQGGIVDLRGKLAEILALKDLERCISNGMSLYRNGDIHCFNERYKNGTEVDGILTFYGEDKYVEMIESLRRMDHIKVKDRWHH